MGCAGCRPLGLLGPGPGFISPDLTCILFVLLQIWSSSFFLGPYLYNPQPALADSFGTARVGQHIATWMQLLASSCCRRAERGSPALAAARGLEPTDVLALVAVGAMLACLAAGRNGQRKASFACACRAYYSLTVGVQQLQQLCSVRSSVPGVQAGTRGA